MQGPWDPSRGYHPERQEAPAAREAGETSVRFGYDSLPRARALSGRSRSNGFGLNPLRKHLPARPPRPGGTTAAHMAVRTLFVRQSARHERILHPVPPIERQPRSPTLDSEPVPGYLQECRSMSSDVKRGLGDNRRALSLVLNPGLDSASSRASADRA